MDILYCVSWFHGANRRKARKVDLDDLLLAAKPSGAGRMIVAFAVIAIAVGVLGYASDRMADAALPVRSVHLGETK